MTSSRASRPSTSSRGKPVARTHASLKKRMRPERSRTQTSDMVVSVRTLANSSPGKNPVVSDIDVEERDLIALERRQAEQPAEARAVTEPREELVADGLQPPFVRLRCGLEDVHTCEHTVL